MDNKKMPEVRDLRDRMKHYEFRRDNDNLIMAIRHFRVGDDERLRLSLSPTFNTIFLVLDKGPDSQIQHTANLYPPIRSGFDAFPKEGEEFIYQYEYGFNKRDGALTVKFRIIDDPKKLPGYCYDMWMCDPNKETGTRVIVLKNVDEVGYRERYVLQLSTCILSEFDLSTGGKGFEKKWDIHSIMLGDSTYKERDAFIEKVHRDVVEAVERILYPKT